VENTESDKIEDKIDAQRALKFPQRCEGVDGTVGKSIDNCARQQKYNTIQKQDAPVGECLF
jgi:hypothetical protein